MFAVLAHLFTPKHTNNHRPRIIHPEGLFVLTTLILTFHVVLRTSVYLTPLGNVLGYASNITASDVMEKVNERRVAGGLKPLTANQQLSNAAAAKATHMFEQQYWSHIAPDGTQPWAFIKNSGYSYSAAGENLAKDFAETSAMVQAWMDSPTHRDNIMQSKYEETGIAVVDGKLQGIETTLVVQMFGSPAKVGAVPSTKKTANKTSPLATTAETVDKNAKQSGFVQSAKAAEELPTEPVHTPEIIQDPSQVTPYFSPTQISKAVFLSMLGMLVCVLLYDAFIERKRNLVRTVGKNVAHIALFVTVAILVIILKGGSLL